MREFQAVVARLGYIERVIKEMKENCGETLDDAQLTDIFSPSLDVTCNNELATIRTDRNRLVDRTSCQELKE